LPEGFAPLFLPAEILPASLVTPPVPVPVVLVAVGLLPLGLAVDEPAVLPLAEDPPAAEPPPALLCARARGPATASAAAKMIIAGFMVSFPCLLQPRDKARESTTFLCCDQI
jgi:hypothetical protein